MRKRIIALFLALILTVGLLPTVALAAGETPAAGTSNDVKNGYYAGTTWTEGTLDQGKLPTGVVSVSKTAKKVEGKENKYEVKLEVVLQQTEENSGKAATVLVLDTSGSMAYCAECGAEPEDDCEHNYVKFDDTPNSSTKYYYKTTDKNGREKFERAYYCDGNHTKPNHNAGWFNSSNNRKHTDGNRLKNNNIYLKTTRTSRLDAAKVAAENFLKTYSGLTFKTDGTPADNQNNRNLGRYVSVVSFASGAALRHNWIDVSNANNYQSVLNKIKTLNPDGGTNLDAGLTYAEYLLKQDTVKNATKNVIALTDGQPTYCLKKNCSNLLHLFNDELTIGNTTYCVHGDGKQCTDEIYNSTVDTATRVKNVPSKIYTVCFDAGETIDVPNSQKKISVSEYLRTKIATQPKAGEKFAYDASNAEQLYAEFAKITQSIVSGLNNGTVKDSLPDGITATGMSGEMTWKLDEDFTAAEPVTTIEDGRKVTTYKYTKTYTVTIDPDDENLVTTKDGYAPLNGETTLTVTVDGEEKEIPFPIPAGKVTPTKINDKITVTITGATNTETYDGTEKKAEGYTVTISDSRYKEADFTFSGTDVVKATNVSANQYMMGLKPGDFTNNNEKFTNVEFVVNDGWLTINKKALTIKANDNTVDYDGDPHGENGYVATGLATGDTVESVTFNGSQTNPGTYQNLLVPSEAVIKNAKGDDVKDNYIITYTPGTLVINKLTNAITVTITGKQETKEYNGQTQTVTGFDYTVTDANKNDVTVTPNQGVTVSASGKDVTSDNNGEYKMNLTKESFTVTSPKYSNITVEYVDGYVKITPAQVTLTSETASKDYDGTPLTKPDVTVGGSGQDVFKREVTGITATGSVTDPGPAVDNTITYTPTANFKENNYNISKSEGKLSINDIAAPTNLPTVNVYCTNGVVNHQQSTGNALKDGTFTSVVSKNAENKYICTITLMDKSSYISDYNDSTAATHTSDSTQTDFTVIVLYYDTVNKAWPTPIVNFALYVKCDTPTVTVTYTWDGFDMNDFDENYPLPTKPGDATPDKGSDYTVDTEFYDGRIVDGKDGVRYKFSGWSTDATIDNGQIKSIQTDVTLTGHWTKLGSGTFDLTNKIFKSFTKADKSNDIPTANGLTYNFEVKVEREDNSSDVRSGSVTLKGNETAAAAFNFAPNNELTFDKAGIYTYSVEENSGYVSPNGAVKGNIINDARKYQLTIKVDGNLDVEAYSFIEMPAGDTPTEVVPTGEPTITFENKYLDDPKADDVYLDLSKYVTKTFESRHGKSATETFEARVEIWVDDVQITTNAAAEEDSIAIYAAANREKVYDKTGTVILSTGETQHFRFDSLATLELGHKYRIKVTETAGSNPDVEYDNRVYDTRFMINGNSKTVEWYDADGGNFSFTNTYTGIDDYYPIIIPTIIGKDTGMLNKTDHFAYVIGYPDGTVHPNGQITRAEVATIFFRLLRDEVRDGAFTTSNTYSDVAYGKWYNNPISTMSALGIITGYPDGTFKPNKPITRAEFAAIAARFDETQSGKSATFSDVIGHWAAKEIGIAYANEWIKGYPDGTFKPDQNITRAEAMTMINRVLERKPESPADLLTNMNKWTDNMDTSKWYYLDVQEATNSHAYTRKTFNYELWRQMLPDPDWSRYER